MLEEKISVRAKAHAKVPFRGTDGRLVGWRFVGRDRVWPHVVLPDGEELTLNARNKHDVLRAITDGDLEKIDAPAPVLAAPARTDDLLVDDMPTHGFEAPAAPAKGAE